MTVKEALVDARPVPKATGAALGGALVVLLSAVLDRVWGIVLTPVEASAITTVVAFIGAWLAPKFDG